MIPPSFTPRRQLPPWVIHGWLRGKFLLVLVLLMLLALPACPVLLRYGTLPRASSQPLTLLVAGVTPNYQVNAPVWPWPAKPEDYTGLTDTLLLVQIHPDGRISVLSIPRDTWMNIPAYGEGKINAANPRGGPEMLKAAVRSLTGVQVDACLMVSLRAVWALTDAAGGVTLTVPSRMKYDDHAGKLRIDLQPGEQHLNGVQAEGFLRFRKNSDGTGDGLGDIGRVTRQQTFLNAMLRRMKNPLNWWHVPGMVGALDRHMKSDLTRQQAGILLNVLVRGPTGLNMQKVPGNFGPHGSWQPDREALRQLLHGSFQGDKVLNLRIAVLNIDAPAGSARRLKAKLQELGYQHVAISFAEPRHAMQITTVTGAASVRGKLREELGYGKVSEVAALPDSDVTIRLGSDTPAQ